MRRTGCLFDDRGALRDDGWGNSCKFSPGCIRDGGKSGTGGSFSGCMELFWLHRGRGDFEDLPPQRTSDRSAHLLAGAIYTLSITCIPTSLRRPYSPKLQLDYPRQSQLVGRGPLQQLARGSRGGAVCCTVQRQRREARRQQRRTHRVTAAAWPRLGLVNKFRARTGLGLGMGWG